ncbi:uncharacterized protein LOC115634332 [Scaptodrosophila lebanonensis]|uniref:Uncharacterized protein LOC115634332 n=1 Tax=Drosophila lebanonensis TaxID=7225 RepID=A0A6J2UKU8_DROLE|nr:uncharacterized protein LOC115634332 [Scaptodrosophila lebanonensis]
MAVHRILFSPFSADIPHAFLCNDSKSMRYCGPYIETALNFARVYRYQLQLEQLEDLPNKLMLQQQIVDGHYNLSLHGVIIRPSENVSQLQSKDVQYSYPIELLHNCVMVPLAPELPKWKYVVWPLGRYIWTTLFVSIFYVGLLMRYVHWHEPRSVTRSFSRNLLYSMAILMYSSNMNLRLMHGSIRMLVFYMQLFLLGFILSNYHISHLTAYDMKPVFLPPINSWADLIASGLRIIIPSTLLEELRLLPEYQELMHQPSRSYSYVVTQDTWEFLNRQQQVLIQPRFHMSKVCFGGLLNALPMRQNVSFSFALDRFLLNVKQAGLWNYWKEIAFRNACRVGLAKIFLDTYPVEPLNLKFFYTAWIVLVVGLSVSSLALCIEHCICRCRERRLQMTL